MCVCVCRSLSLSPSLPSLPPALASRNPRRQNPLALALLLQGGDAWGGKGVTKAVSNVNSIIGPTILGKCPLDQRELDTLMVQELDGTQNEWG